MDRFFTTTPIKRLGSVSVACLLVLLWMGSASVCSAQARVEDGERPVNARITPIEAVPNSVAGMASPTANIGGSNQNPGSSRVQPIGSRTGMTPSANAASAQTAQSPEVQLQMLQAQRSQSQLNSSAPSMVFKPGQGWVAIPPIPSSDQKSDVELRSGPWQLNATPPTSLQNSSTWVNEADAQAATSLNSAQGSSSMAGHGHALSDVSRACVSGNRTAWSANICSASGESQSDQAAGGQSNNSNPSTGIGGRNGGNIPLIFQTTAPIMVDSQDNAPTTVVTSPLAHEKFQVLNSKGTMEESKSISYLSESDSALTASHAQLGFDLREDEDSEEMEAAQTKKKKLQKMQDAIMNPLSNDQSHQLGQMQKLGQQGPTSQSSSLHNKSKRMSDLNKKSSSLNKPE